MRKVKYLGKRWKVIDELPLGSLVLQRWVMGNVGLFYYPYLGIVITTPDTVEEL